MQFYADTANLQQIKELLEWFPIDGITSNPTLVSREKRQYLNLVNDLLEVVPGLVHCQVLATSCEGIVSESERLRSINPERIIPKIPVTQQGLAAIRDLAKQGIPTTATAIVTVSQGVMAAKCGASYLAPYVNRVDTIEQSGTAMVIELQQALAKYSLESKVLAASIKTTQQLKELILSGIYGVTIHPALFEQALSHPLTDQAIASFQADWLTVFDQLNLSSDTIKGR